VILTVGPTPDELGEIRFPKIPESCRAILPHRWLGTIA
jgi:hypothetical protein